MRRLLLFLSDRLGFDVSVRVNSVTLAPGSIAVRIVGLSQATEDQIANVFSQPTCFSDGTQRYCSVAAQVGTGVGGSENSAGSSTSAALVGGIVGGAIVLLVVIVLVLAAVVIQRRARRAEAGFQQRSATRNPFFANKPEDAGAPPYDSEPPLYEYIPAESRAAGEIYLTPSMLSAASSHPPSMGYPPSYTEYDLADLSSGDPADDSSPHSSVV